MSHSQPTTDQQAARKTTRRGEIVYDTQSILGRKRGLVAASAHTFENVKLTKQWELDHVIPLSLALPPRRPIPPSNIREDRAVLRHRRRLLPRLSELPGSLERLPESSSAPKAPPNSSTHSAPTSTPNPGTDTIVTEPPLLHPELVLLVQQLYYDERQEALTPPQATQLWSSHKSQHRHKPSLHWHLHLNTSLAGQNVLLLQAHPIPWRCHRRPTMSLNGKLPIPLSACAKPWQARRRRRFSTSLTGQRMLLLRPGPSSWRL
ncbi:hypothetical protein BN946_scf184962.g91 [Trametes cinnabarina]|uniref:Uncharacterized protein n=1 Tax=Pycnoporus cinnabarinus TaxID=5643 RepID=A0A060SI85_PYCCI|nr:hypothetical protein BN946_scf184962.g91 [Trametes cinnabarina]